MHYHKVYQEPNAQSRGYWINEMQNRFNEVKSLKLKQNKKPLLNSEINDWFLTAGAYPEDFVDMDYNEQKAYDEFSLRLLTTNSVEKSL